MFYCGFWCKIRRGGARNAKMKNSFAIHVDCDRNAADGKRAPSPPLGLFFLVGIFAEYILCSEIFDIAYRFLKLRFVIIYKNFPCGVITLTSRNSKTPKTQKNLIFETYCKKLNLNFFFSRTS